MDLNGPNEGIYENEHEEAYDDEEHADDESTSVRQEAESVVYQSESDGALEDAFEHGESTEDNGYEEYNSGYEDEQQPRSDTNTPSDYGEEMLLDEAVEEEYRENYIDTQIDIILSDQRRRTLWNDYKKYVDEVVMNGLRDATECR